MKKLQGPAVIVWNDKTFTDEDLNGIQQLGVGAKGKKVNSIGKFGLGFNVAYHGKLVSFCTQ